MKLCKDCKHFSTQHFSTLSCVRDAQWIPDYVFGGETEHHTNLLYAYEERENTTDPTACGPEAKFWEPIDK